MAAGKDKGELPEGWDADDGEPLATEELALTDEEERLPWLESSDDEYDDGADGGRMIGFVLMGLVALAAIIGAIYWATNRKTDPQLADGGLIAAPAEPYKTAPKDAGGKTFAGTGDSSFAVSEGQTRPAQLGSGAAKPGAPAAAGAATGTAPAGGVGVQVGAFGSNAAAEQGWGELTTRYAAILGGAKHRVVQGTAERGTVFRLQAVAPDASAANALCGKIKAAGGSCQVK